MPIDAKFSQEDVKRRVDKFIEVIIKRQIQRMQMLGEMCITHAREVPPEIGFTDQTGNLRSSEGYVVFLDGVAVHENYEQFKQGTEGMMVGKNLANKVGAKYKNGVSLVVTAGMSYAVHLEAKGRDVLASAEVLAKKELPKMLQELKKNINKALS